MKISAVIFDMDGVILDTEPVAMRAMGQAIRERLGREMTFEFFRSLIGHSRSDTYPIFEREYGLDIPGTNAVRDRCGELVTQAVARGEGKMKPGVLEVLDFLDSRHLVRGVASSSPRRQVWLKLRMAGLACRFNAVVSGWEVPQSKPDPAIFLLAAERLDTPPEECLVLEDSQAGVEAAYRAKMPCFMIPDLVPPEEADRRRAAAVLKTIDEAIAYLK